MYNSQNYIICDNIKLILVMVYLALKNTPLKYEHLYVKIVLQKCHNRQKYEWMCSSNNIKLFNLIKMVILRWEVLCCHTEIMNECVMSLHLPEDRCPQKCHILTSTFCCLKMMLLCLSCYTMCQLVHMQNAVVSSHKHNLIPSKQWQK